MFTAELLREKLPEKDKSYTRILKGLGRVTFRMKGDNEVGVYDASNHTLCSGTFKGVAGFINGRANGEEPQANGEEPQAGEKPERGLKKEKPERPETGVTSVPEVRGSGSGKGTSYRARLFGLPITAAIRWMWADGFDFHQIKAACASFVDPPPQDTTLKLQRRALRKGDKAAPELSDENAKQLRKFKLQAVATQK